MTLFGILYLAFTIIFGIHLDQSDDNLRGHCYDSRHLALPNAQHTYVDKIYMGITCLYMFATLFATVFLAIARCEVDPAWGKKRSALANTTIHFCREWSKIYAPR